MNGVFTVETRGGSDADVFVRTTLAIDGDVVIALHPRALGDAALLARNSAAVRAAICRLTREIRLVEGVLRAGRWLVLAVSAISVVGGVSELAVGDLAEAGLWLAVFAGGWTARAMGSKLLHRRLHAKLATRPRRTVGS